MRHHVRLVWIGALLSLASLASAAETLRAQESLHSTYVGERGGYAIHRIEVPQSKIVIETLSNDSGETLLTVSNKATGQSQAFSIPKRAATGEEEISAQTTGSVELNPIIIRSDGSGVFEVRLDGEFIGFMTVSSSGVWNFIPVQTQPK